MSPGLKKEKEEEEECIVNKRCIGEAFPSFFTLFFIIQLYLSGRKRRHTAEAPTHLFVSWTNMADL